MKLWCSVREKNVILVFAEESQVRAKCVLRDDGALTRLLTNAVCCQLNEREVVAPMCAQRIGRAEQGAVLWIVNWPAGGASRSRRNERWSGLR
jgi:hypothetical protein